MYKKLVACCIIALFIATVLLNFGSDLSLTKSTDATTTPLLLPPLIPYDINQRDYNTLFTYVLVLLVGSVMLLFNKWFAQSKYRKNQLLGLPLTQPPISAMQHILLFERRWFNLTWSLLSLLKVSGLLLVNLLIWMKDMDYNQVTLLKEHDMYLQTLANRSAQLAITNIAFSILLSAKLSIIQRWFFCVHQTLNYHTWFGLLGFLQVLYHGTFQLQSNYDGDLVATVTTSIRYVTGFSMLTALSILMLGSHPTIRYFSYRLFHWTHIGAFTTLVLFGCLHHWSFTLFYATTLLFWMLDQIDRSFVTENIQVESLPGDIVKLTCQVPFSTTLIPGQFAFISFGSISWIRAWFHSNPFSICRLDHGESIENETTASEVFSNTEKGHQYFTFYIKAVGKETKALYHHGTMKARISRPLGRPYITNAGSEFGDYDRIVLIAEGMGITPWISVLNHIKEKQHAIKTQSVDLIWSIHSIDTFYAFEKEFEQFSDSIQQQQQYFNIKIFVTGTSVDPEEDYSIPNSLTFIKFILTTRPNHPSLLSKIQQQQKTTATTVLGICAHEETTITCFNTALLYSWHTKIERFEL